MRSCTDMDKIIFSDEKLFTVEAICNQQNDQVLAKSFADVPDSRQRVFICQKPSFVIVWAATSKNMEVSKEIVVPGSLSAFLEQGGLATLITRPEGDGLLCLVPFRSRCLCFSSWVN